VVCGGRLVGEPVALAFDVPEQKEVILYDDGRQQEPKRLSGKSIGRHLLLHLWAVGEDDYRAVWNSAFNATTTTAPATKAATYPSMFVMASPSRGTVFSAVTERANAIAASKNLSVSSRVTLRRPTITPWGEYRCAPSRR